MIEVSIDPVKSGHNTSGKAYWDSSVIRLRNPALLCGSCHAPVRMMRSTSGRSCVHDDALRSWVASSSDVGGW